MEAGGFIGPYRLERPAGEGGMGSVWVARHPTLDRRVAVKLIRSEVKASPQAREAFLREVRVLSKLHGPQILQVVDFGFTESGDPYMVTEFLDGEDLLARVRRTGPVPVAEAIGIGAEVLKALAEAHAVGLVHRDLKPGNVFLQKLAGDRTAVKVLDFGVAKLLEGSEEDTLWPEARLKGSPRYMSPEQVRSAEITPATDIYAFGALMYRILTGEPVFPGRRNAVLKAHVQTRPQPMRERNPDLGIPEEVDDIVLCCLEKSPADRPGSASALFVRLERLAGRLKEADQPSPPVEVGPLSLDFSGGDLSLDEPAGGSAEPAAEPVAEPAADVGAWFSTTGDDSPAAFAPTVGMGGLLEPPAGDAGGAPSGSVDTNAAGTPTPPPPTPSLDGWGVEPSAPLELDLDDAGRRKTASGGAAMEGVAVPEGGIEFEDAGDEVLELAFEPETRKDPEPPAPEPAPAASAPEAPPPEDPLTLSDAPVETPVDSASGPPPADAVELEAARAAGRGLADRPDGYRPAPSVSTARVVVPWYEQYRTGLIAGAAVLSALVLVWIVRGALVGGEVEATADAGPDVVAAVADAGPRTFDIGATPVARDRGVAMTSTPSVVRGPAARMGAPDPSETPTVLVRPDPGPASFVRVSDGETICEEAPHCRVPIDVDVKVVKKGYRTLRLRGDDLYDRRGSTWRVILRR